MIVVHTGRFTIDQKAPGTILGSSQYQSVRLSAVTCHRRPHSALSCPGLLIDHLTKRIGLYVCPSLIHLVWQWGKHTECLKDTILGIIEMKMVD